MISLLSTVKLDHLAPQIVLGLAIFDQLVDETFPAGSLASRTVVTCGSNGKHFAPNSLHPKGAAVDIRSHDHFRGEEWRKRQLDDFAAKVRQALGPDFDLILEDLGGENEHWHLEYDPKGRMITEMN